MFQAIKEVKEFGEKREKLFVNGENGDRIMDQAEAADFVRNYFVKQFSDVTRDPIEAHETKGKPLEKPISASEVASAIKKMNNRRAVGLDNLCAEMLKNGPPELPSLLADIYNLSMANGEDLGLGLGKLKNSAETKQADGACKECSTDCLTFFTTQALVVDYSRKDSIARGFFFVTSSQWI